MPLLVHNSALGLSLGFGRRIFLKSLHKTLIIVYSLGVLTELLAPRLQTEPGEGKCPACLLLSVHGLCLLCCLWSLLLRSLCSGTEQGFFPKPPKKDLTKGGVGMSVESQQTSAQGMMKFQLTAD